MDSLPTPPNEEVVRPQSLKRPHAVSKSIKTVHRTLKRTTTHAHPPSPARDSHSQHGDGRHKRVWKACERCRMKKTKCDGEFPCKRCKDDGLICTAGTRKKTEYKQLPPGYAEVLENTQFVLIATVQKLYSMVRNGDPWELGEPELNDRGQPVVHNVAAKLGCLRPNSDLDLPVHSIFPEDEAGMAELARQLQEHATTSTPANGPSSQNSSVEASNTYHHHHHHQTDRASSSAAASDAEHSDLDLDTDYRRAAFGGAASTVSLSPASLSYADFDISPSDTGFPPTSQQSPALPTHPNSFQQQQQQQQWANSRPTSMDFSTQPQLWMAASQGFMEPDVINSGVLGSSYGMKPQGFSASCRNPGVMMGMGDPMIFSGYDEDALRPLFSGGNI